MQKLSSRDQELIRNIVIKYASGDREAGFWDVVKMLPIAVAALTPFQKDALAAEGFTVQVGVSGGHFGIVAGPAALTHMLGHHQTDTAENRPHYEDPIGGAHHIIEAVAHKLEDLKLKKPNGDLLREQELVEGIKKQVEVVTKQVQEKKKPQIIEKSRQELAQNSGGSLEGKPKPPARSIQS